MTTTTARRDDSVQPSPRPYRLTKIITADGVLAKILSSNGDEMAVLRSAGGRKEANGEFIVDAMNTPRLDMETFHNALRVMQNFDRSELVEAGVIDEDDRAEWTSFTAHPYNWFIRVGDHRAAKLWPLICSRMTGRR